MKFRLLVFLCLCSAIVSAQNISDLLGSWVVKNVTNADGSELPDENIQKYTFMKYTFESQNRVSMTQTFYQKGKGMFFELSGDMLLLKLTAEGSVLNRIEVQKASHDSLVLLSSGLGGPGGPTLLKYTFIPENTAQRLTPLTTSDVYAISGKDTIYNESPKIYAAYNDDDFGAYLRANIGHGDYMHNKSGHIVATFIVNKTGLADSLKIVQGINANYDKYLSKAFNSAKKDWNPATLNGKNVSVKMEVRITYYGNTSDMVQAFQFTQDAGKAYGEGKYEAALSLYNEALSYHPTNTTNLYNRAICKLKLNDTAGACADWQKIKSLGENVANIISKKYCK